MDEGGPMDVSGSGGNSGGDGLESGESNSSKDANETVNLGRITYASGKTVAFIIQSANPQQTSDDDKGGNEITASSLGLGKKPTAEMIADGLWHMKVGDYITGKEISKIRPELKNVQKGLNKVTRTTKGLKIDLNWKAIFLLKTLPKTPNVEDGSVISLERTLWVDNKSSVIHITSSTIKIYYGNRKVGLDIYLHNNGYTMDKEPYPYYYPVWKTGGHWSDPN